MRQKQDEIHLRIQDKRRDAARGVDGRLVQRQEEEIAYYNRAKAEIEAAQKTKMPAAQLNDLWEKRNESLRQMGVKLVPMPE